MGLYWEPNNAYFAHFKNRSESIIELIIFLIVEF